MLNFLWLPGLTLGLVKSVLLLGYNSGPVGIKNLPKVTNKVSSKTLPNLPLEFKLGTFRL